MSNAWKPPDMGTLKSESGLPSCKLRTEAWRRDPRPRRTRFGGAPRVNSGAWLKSRAGAPRPKGRHPPKSSVSEAPRAGDRSQSPWTQAMCRLSGPRVLTCHFCNLYSNKLRTFSASLWKALGKQCYLPGFHLLNLSSTSCWLAGTGSQQRSALGLGPWA